MANTPLKDRLEAYCQRQNIAPASQLGYGKDGHVWQTFRPSAVKIHEQEASYTTEIAAYIRLTQKCITNIAGFAVPKLIDFDDELLALEISIVSPPYLLDFASAILDRPSDLIEDEGNTLADLVHARFGDRAPEIMFLQHQLATRAGVHITDLHAHNIKFAPPSR